MDFDLEKETSEFAKNVIRLCERLHRNVIGGEKLGLSFAASFGTTQKEAKEAHEWLQLLEEANLEYKKEIEKLLKEAVELKKIFSSLADKSF